MSSKSIYINKKKIKSNLILLFINVNIPILKPFQLTDSVSIRTEVNYWYGAIGKNCSIN
jgi:hypothetical protein